MNIRFESKLNYFSRGFNMTDVLTLPTLIILSNIQKFFSKVSSQISPSSKNTALLFHVIVIYVLTLPEGCLFINTKKNIYTETRKITLSKDNSGFLDCYIAIPKSKK